jgi:hypothetical protein
MNWPENTECMGEMTNAYMYEYNWVGKLEGENPLGRY